MQRGTDRIRTPTSGSLARPPALLDLMRAAAGGQPVDPAELAETERLAVADVVARQRSAGKPPIGETGYVEEYLHDVCFYFTFNRVKCSLYTARVGGRA